MTKKEWVWLATIATAAFAANGAIGLSSTAKAAELEIPKSHPLVAVDIPDDWSIDRSTFAVVMQSPEKNSIVVASVVAGDKDSLDGWNKQAGEKLKAFGVQFNTTPQTASPQVAKKEAPSNSQTDTKQTDTKQPDVKPHDAKKLSPDESLATILPNTTASGFDHAFAAGSGSLAFAGAPSLKEMGLDNASAPPKAKVPFRSVQIKGATLDGKKVDVQLLIYFISEKQRFLMLQESGENDDRAVAMAQSVRPLKAAP